MRLVDGDARMLLNEGLVLGREEFAGHVIGGIEKGGRRLREGLARKGKRGDTDQQKALHENLQKKQQHMLRTLSARKARCEAIRTRSSR